MSIIEGVRFGRAETAPGITLRYAEMGDGPLVLLAHGFPESWYNWRHQMPALAAAGFRGPLCRERVGEQNRFERRAGPAALGARLLVRGACGAVEAGSCGRSPRAPPSGCPHSARA